MKELGNQENGRQDGHHLEEEVHLHGEVGQPDRPTVDYQRSYRVNRRPQLRNNYSSRSFKTNSALKRVLSSQLYNKVSLGM